jgi:Immunity protein Imm1
MVDLSISVHDAEPAARISTPTELERVIRLASEEARARKMLNIIILEAANGNNLSFVVGGDDTVVSFTYGHRNPPYYASRGAQASTHPIMTCYVGLVHHTEFAREYVISFERGLTAVQEFAESGALPQSIEWMET